MGVELSSDLDLVRRVEARNLLANARSRIRCKRCRKEIPLTRRRDALYCSTRCHANYRRECITELRTEVRAARRQYEAPKNCIFCGGTINPVPGKRGSIPKYCSKKCRDNLNQRKYELRKKLKER